jgi:hypothetical protein
VAAGGKGAGPGLRFQKLPVGADRVRVRHDGGKGDALSRRRDHPASASPFHDDPPDRNAGPDVDPELLDQPGQGLGDSLDAPLGVYQIPSEVCMWAMPQSTAGEASGAEPTYWVK